MNHLQCLRFHFQGDAPLCTRHQVQHKLAKPRLPLDDVPDFSPQILCWPAKLKEPKAQAEKLCLKFQNKNGTLFRLQTLCNGSVKGMVKRRRWKPL